MNIASTDSNSAPYPREILSLSTLSIYRILFIDRHERVTAIDDFDAVTKTDAIEICTHRRGLHHAVELWLGGALITRHGPPKAASDRKTRQIG